MAVSWAQMAKLAAHKKQPPLPPTKEQRQAAVKKLRESYEQELYSKSHQERLAAHDDYLTSIAKYNIHGELDKEIARVKKSIDFEKLSHLPFKPADLPNEPIERIVTGSCGAFFICKSRVIRFLVTPSDPFGASVVLSGDYDQLIGKILRNVIHNRDKMKRTSFPPRDFFDFDTCDEEHFELQTDDITIECTSKLSYEYCNATIMKLEVANRDFS